MRSILNGIVLFLLLAVLVPIPTAHGKNQGDPEMTDIILTTSAEDLLLFATVKNGFTQEMLQGVRNGIPITFDFDIELEKIRSFWPNKTLVARTIRHKMTFNSLKETFQIIRSEKNNQAVTSRSLDRARSLMAELNGIPLIKRARLIPDASYVLRVKATLVENTLPLGMHYIIPFTSLWNFETDWRSVQFRY